MPLRPRASRTLSLVIAAALLAAACGDDASPDEGRPSGLSSLMSGDADGASGDGGDVATGAPGSVADAALVDWAADQENVVDLAPGEVTFDVTFSDDTVVVSPAAVRQGTGDHTYTLDAGAAGGLDRGSVLLIPGVALRRVTAVDRSGDEVRVSTEFAALTDAIVDGEIGWDVGLGPLADFQTDPDTTPRVAVDASAARTAPAGLEPVEVGVTLGDGTMRQVAWTRTGDEDFPLQWRYSQDGLDYVFALGPGAEHVTVYIQVTRDVGGRTSMAYTAEGRIELPRTSGSVSIRGGQLRGAEIDQQGLSGTIDLTAVVAGGGGKIPFEFELPGIWFKYIVPVGPIPVTIGITAKLVGDVEVPAEASASASSSFSFGGDLGFRYEGTTVEPRVNMPDLGIVPEPADSAATFGNYVNAEFGVAFPEVSISLFDQGVIPRVFPAMYVGSRLQWGPLCKTGYMRIEVRGGFDFRILGVNLHSIEAVDLVEPYERRGSGEGCES